MSDHKPRESLSLKTDDIAGAKPFIKSYQYTNKSNYSNSTAGIDKSSPSNKEFLTNRQTNPLNPEYILPTHTSKPHTPPKYIRDTLDISDINGNSSKPLYKIIIRNSLDVSDISPKNKEKTAWNKNKDLIDEEKILLRRNTNPLTPEYLIRDHNNQLIRYGTIQGNSPRNSINIQQPPHNRHLDVSDIKGNANSKSFVYSINDDTSFKKPNPTINRLIGSRLPIGFVSKLPKSASNSGASSPNSYTIMSNSPKTNASTLSTSKSLKDINSFSMRASFDSSQGEKTVFSPTQKNSKRPLPRSPILSPKSKK